MLGVSDGLRALELARSSQPDAILLDLMMPEVTGFDVLAGLRLDPATADIPVFVITAKELTAEEAAVLSRGVTAVFRKGDLRAADLRATLAAVLEQARAPV